MPGPVLLRANPAPDDETWEFTFNPNLLSTRQKPGISYGKLVTLRPTGIFLQMEQFPSNRVLNSDEGGPSKFLLLSIDRLFRFEEQPMKVVVHYVLRLFKRGLWLNGVQYRFYGHSNSQLVSICIPELQSHHAQILVARAIVLSPRSKLRPRIG